MISGKHLAYRYLEPRQGDGVDHLVATARAYVPVALERRSSVNFVSGLQEVGQPVLRDPSGGVQGRLHLPVEAHRGVGDVHDQEHVLRSRMVRREIVGTRLRDGGVRLRLGQLAEANRVLTPDDLPIDQLHTLRGADVSEAPRPGEENQP